MSTKSWINRAAGSIAGSISPQADQVDHKAFREYQSVAFCRPGQSRAPNGRGCRTWHRETTLDIHTLEAISKLLEPGGVHRSGNGISASDDEALAMSATVKAQSRTILLAVTSLAYVRELAAILTQPIRRNPCRSVAPRSCERLNRAGEYARQYSR